MLYYDAGALRFAFLSACLLVGQFMVVWLRVLPYLQVTYGTGSTFYRVFLWFGMPLGCFFFDFLMFLGPFGLLPIAPMPEAMRLFVPAYAATRMIAEVLVEAFPQFIMQVRGGAVSRRGAFVCCVFDAPTCCDGMVGGYLCACELARA